MTTTANLTTDDTLPAGWKWARLGEVADVIAGQSPPGTSYNNNGIGVPFYQGKKEFGETFIGEPMKWTTDPRRFADKDDILMSVRAPVGPVNLATRRICVGRGLAIIRPVQDRLTTWYAFYFLQSMESDITGNTGSIFASINKREIEAIPIPLPPLSEQKRIARVLDECLASVAKAKDAAEAQMEAIDALPGAYLSKAFAGEL